MVFQSQVLAHPALPVSRQQLKGDKSTADVDQVYGTHPAQVDALEDRLK